MSEPTNPNQPNQQQVQIKADEKELLGQYANLAIIHHNGEEFTLNFIYLFPSVPQGKLVSSIILSPGHAKRMLAALKENVARFESQFGTLPEGSGGPIPDSSSSRVGDNPLARGLQKFQADGEACFRNELAVGDAGHRAERTGQSRDGQLVPGFPAASAEHASAA